MKEIKPGSKWTRNDNPSTVVTVEGGLIVISYTIDGLKDSPVINDARRTFLAKFTPTPNAEVVELLASKEPKKPVATVPGGQPRGPGGKRKRRREIEGLRDTYLRAVQENGSMAKAAVALGVPRTTFWERAGALGVNPARRAYRKRTSSAPNLPLAVEKQVEFLKRRADVAASRPGAEAARQAAAVLLGDKATRALSEALAAAEADEVFTIDVDQASISNAVTALNLLGFTHNQAHPDGRVTVRVR